VVVCAEFLNAFKSHVYRLVTGFVPLCFAPFDQVEPTTPPEDARKAGVIDAVGQYLAASHDEFP